MRSCHSLSAQPPSVRLQSQRQKGGLSVRQVAFLGLERGEEEGERKRRREGEREGGEQEGGREENRKEGDGR